MTANAAQSAIERKRSRGARTKSLKRARQRAVLRQKGRCIWCGVKMTAPNTEEPTSATLEHITPVTDGGGSTKHNLAAACKRCNNERPVQRLLNEMAKNTAMEERLRAALAGGADA